jgi:hypothetical protein
VATPLAGWHPALYGALRTYTAVTAGQAGFSRTTPFGPPDTAARVGAAADFNRDGSLDLAVGDENALR